MKTLVQNPVAATPAARHRAALELSQESIATTLGICRRQWQYFESGEKDSPPWLIFALLFLVAEKTKAEGRDLI